MQFSYDSKHNVAYLKFRKKTQAVKTIQLSDELNVDIAPNGKVYGIEFLNPNDQFSQTGSSSLEFVNAVSGQKTMIRME